MTGENVLDAFAQIARHYLQLWFPRLANVYQFVRKPFYCILESVTLQQQLDMWLT